MKQCTQEPKSEHAPRTADRKTAPMTHTALTRQAKRKTAARGR
jgi:hypothetical protein